MDDGLRVGLDQGFRYFFATDFRDGAASGGEHGDALLGVVSVGGQHMDRIVLQAAREVLKIG